MALLRYQDTLSRGNAATAGQTIIKGNLCFFQLLLPTILKRHIIEVIKGTLLSNFIGGFRLDLDTNLVDLNVATVFFYLNFGHRFALFLMHFDRFDTFL